MKPDRAQDWDIRRAYEAIRLPGAMMPYSDAEMVMESFCLTQNLVIHELSALLPSLPDASAVPPILREEIEYEFGLQFGAPDWFELDGDEELLETKSREAWETFWLKGAKFEDIFSTTLVYDFTPQHKLFHSREGIPPLAQFTYNWDFPKNLVTLELYCWSCSCSWDKSTHGCQGLSCEVKYTSSYIPSEFLKDTVFTISSFLKAHYYKHAWAWYGDPSELDS